MPKVFRVMKIENGKPMIGASKTMLGVVIDGPEARAKQQRPDVMPNAKGLIAPGQGGMSVSPNIAQLPAHLLPKRFKHLNPKASGDNRYHCWSFGEGLFESAPIGDALALNVDRPAEHGLIEPRYELPADKFQRLLADSVELWEIDESEQIQ